MNNIIVMTDQSGTILGAVDSDEASVIRKTQLRQTTTVLYDDGQQFLQALEQKKLVESARKKLSDGELAALQSHFKENG